MAPDNFVKVSWYIRKDLYEMMRNIAYHDRRTQKEIVEEALERYFNEKVVNE